MTSCVLAHRLPQNRDEVGDHVGRLGMCARSAQRRQEKESLRLRCGRGLGGHVLRREHAARISMKIVRGKGL